MRYKYSFIIPTYNGEKTIGLLLEKLAAIRDYTIEIIIIDSDSHDHTLLKIQPYIKKNHPFKIIKINKNDFNHGLTRNLGVAAAKGKYVCFFSQDVYPTTKKFLKYFDEDFSLDKKIVAVFGKQIASKETPFFQKMEIEGIFYRLDKNCKNGIALHYLSTPSPVDIPTSYSLFNPFSCYKRSFLLKYPFPKTRYGEDIQMGKTILSLGYKKVYDKRCKVVHFHKLNVSAYYRRQLEEIILWSSLIKIRDKVYFFSKINYIWSLKMHWLVKLYRLLEMSFFYFLKLVAVIHVKYFIKNYA